MPVHPLVRAGAATAAAVAMTTTTPAAATTQQTLLTCQVSTTERPITFDPPVTRVRRNSGLLEGTVA
ncbi:hypothetical protein [Nonomuraea sp. B5E05]|uniref:hypothetical protein n=1 Tax=Nonomuraea sp. B5E05 TaxID=3153569 RepID=UPI0032604C3E